MSKKVDGMYRANRDITFHTAQYDWTCGDGCCSNREFAEHEMLHEGRVTRIRQGSGGAYCADDECFIGNEADYEDGEYVYVKLWEIEELIMDGKLVLV